jgi:hypothetical protein
MSNSTTMPGQKPRQQANTDDAVLDPAASSVLRTLRIGTSPLSWWRMLPAHAFRAADYLRICAALDELAAFANSIVPALKGDPDVAIALVLSLIPIRTRSAPVDVAMTAVLRCVLDGDLRCALVLGHVIDRADLDPVHAANLCASWFEFHLDHARAGFTPAEEAVLKALHAFDARAPDDAGG